MQNKLQIDLGDLGAAFEARAPNPLDETMSRALESPRGIALEFTTPGAAWSKRFQFYKRRNVLRDAGIKSFDSLIFQLSANRLIIKREEEFKEIEL
jgi:hypothetical protein